MVDINPEMEYFQLLDENGNVKGDLPNLTPQELKDMFKWMITSRKFDKKLVNMQRQGRLGTYAEVSGQEACQVGSMFASKKEDWVAPAFRESLAFMLKGVPLHKIIMYFAGDERGSETDAHILPVAIPIAGQTLSATGLAYAMKYKKENNAVLTFFGDGATSEGEFHEAMNFAGVFKLPVIFLCQNNKYAISVPRDKQTASKTIAQKAIAYGFEGKLVDGNDVFAVYQATKEALEKAYNGEGPTLIELDTYRLSNHTTSDNAKKYRSDKEVEQWKPKDPILRLKNYLLNNNIITQEEIDIIEKEVDELIEKEVEIAEKIPQPNIKDIFQYNYTEMPKDLKEQYTLLQEEVGKKEEEQNGSN